MTFTRLLQQKKQKRNFKNMTFTRLLILATTKGTKLKIAH